MPGASAHIFRIAEAQNWIEDNAMPIAIASRKSTCLMLLVFLLPSALAAEESLRPWRDYQTIMWIGDSAYKKPEKIPAFFARLREMGITTAMISGDDDPTPVWTNQYPYYVENMINRGLCLKWNSNVRDWDKFVTQWTKSGRPAASLVRDYCLDDPAYQKISAKQMESLVKKHMGHSPLLYNIRDELSVTISANPFDYDFNPLALAAFRVYLKTRYESLAKLNAEWGTSFAGWEDVKPFTTDQIKNRMGGGDAIPRGNPDWQAVEVLRFDAISARKQPMAWNFAPWADFRTYMDISLAKTLGALRDTAHASDPHTPVGIEGLQQASAFGGYDLWRLSQILDWAEPYDIGNSREILGSFMPGRRLVTTVFEKESNPARRRLWHLLLEGDKGCLIWWSEDCIDTNSNDYALTAKAKALAPVLKEMASPLAKLFLRATPEQDPICIVYSQPSIQVDWLIESTEDGSTWLRRFSSFEAEHNRQAKVRDSWFKAFQDLGFSPSFVSSEQVEHGLLDTESTRAIVLPCAWAMADGEATALQKFASHDGVIYCDGTPGLFDEHGKLRDKSPLEMDGGLVAVNQATVLSKGVTPDPWKADVALEAQHRLVPTPDSGWLDWVNSHCPITAPVTVQLNPPANRAAARCRIHRYHLGDTTLLAFERNIDHRMDEDLKQAGGNESLQKPITLDAKLAHGGCVYDLRTNRYLGKTDHFSFTLDPWQPSLFAVTSKELPENAVLDTLLADADRKQ
jgi:hypothetical protein